MEFFFEREEEIALSHILANYNLVLAFKLLFQGLTVLELSDFLEAIRTKSYDSSFPIDFSSFFEKHFQTVLLHWLVLSDFYKHMFA